MGTDLQTIGNHNIGFMNRSYHEIAEDIISRLNKLKLDNASFLNDYDDVNDWSNEYPWYYQPNDDHGYYSRYNLIEIFKGDDSYLSVNPYKVNLYFPICRYGEWMNKKLFDGSQDILVRNEWRKVYSLIIHALAGDRVIYMADNAHVLEHYTEYEGSFAELETQLQSDLGLPSSSLENAYNNDSYYIDHLNDIHWDINTFKINKHFLVFHFFTKCFQSQFIRTNFPSFFNEIQSLFDFDFKENKGLYYETLQINHITKYLNACSECCFVARENPGEIVFSLQNTNASVTVFYQPFDNIFSLIEHKIAINEINRYKNIHRFFVLKAGKFQYIFDHKGVYQFIYGVEISFVHEPSNHYPIINFAIAKDKHGRYSIYDNELEYLCCEVNDFKIYSYKYCIAGYTNNQSLYSFDSSIKLGYSFVSAQYFHHPNFVKNQLHYFVLKNAYNKYALFQLKDNTLYNNFDWDDFSANDNYNYLFYKTDDQWFKINILSLKSTKVDHPEFTDNYTVRKKDNYGYNIP